MIRPTSLYLDSILGRKFPALDHGFVRVVDYMGTETSVCEAARVSYDKGTKTRSDDRGLIRYLMRHHHSTPFEMCEIRLHVKLPIFVARQWIRHRTANVNEMSARYSILDSEFYIPEAEHLVAQSSANKQGGGEVLGPEEAARVLDILREDSLRSYENYQEMIGDCNLARELARMNLPTNIYTQWHWKIDLHNLLHFLRLRLDSHAQREIRVYAAAIDGIVAEWVPEVWAAFVDYRLLAHTFSAQEMGMLLELLSTADVGKVGDAFYEAAQRLSDRELRAFYSTLDLDVEDFQDVR